MTDKEYLSRMQSDCGDEWRNSLKHYNWQGWLSLGLLWGMAILWFLPVLWMISTSLKPESMVLTLKPQWIPPVATLANYFRALQKAPILTWFFNSTVVAVAGTILVLIVDAMAAYAFARVRFTGSKFLFILTLSTMMIPSQITIVPLYLLFNRMNLLDTMPAVILPRASAAIGVFMLRQFLLGVPTELEEAARIDGCSRYGIFWRIILPLTRPALAALGIFTFVWSWNDFLWPLIILSSRENYTLPIGIATLIGNFARDYGMAMAGAVIASIPTFLVFLFFQRQFIKGIATTGLKG